MCTLTYIPPQGEYTSIITHSRDEQTNRLPSLLPRAYSNNKQTLYYPIDQDAGGTWFCVDNAKRTVCILNGAFKKYVPQPPYQKSRGEIVLEAMKAQSFEDFLQSVNLNNIAPFTLICFELLKIIEFRWDGEKKHYKKPAANQPHIWSSATLYNEETQKKRINWFVNWIVKNGSTPAQMFDFHQNGGQGNISENIKMRVNNTHKTVSITQVYADKLAGWMNHVNFVTEEQETISLA